MTLAVRHAHPGDARLLAPRLRQADRDEIDAASGRPHEWSLAEGYQRSACCWTGYEVESDLPVAMFGVVPSDVRGVGHPWLLGSGAISTHRKEFLRLTREYLPHVEAGWTLLWNYVMEANEVHVRWIRALGFKFVGREPEYGAGRVPFLLFQKHL